MSNSLFSLDDFPATQEIYLDSASTSRTPYSVIGAMEEYYTHTRAPSHRGMYTSAARVTRAVESARDTIARYIDASNEEIIFTSGSTHAAHLLVSTLEHNLTLNEGDEILVTELDHHATLVPLQMLARRKKLKLVVVPVDSQYGISQEVFQVHLSSKTKIVSLVHVSNVTGTVCDIDMLTSIAHAYNAFVMIDGAQSVGHVPMSFRTSGADALFFSGHKMCGPTGVGVLVLKQKWIAMFEPPYGGGGTVHSVTSTSVSFLENKSKFEAGTLPLAEIIGLEKAVMYVHMHTVDAVHAHTLDVKQYALLELQKYKWLHTYTHPTSPGIVSFSVPQVHPHDIAFILAEHGVAVRAGFQCAELITRKVSSNGVVRLSAYGYTSLDDINRCIGALNVVAKTFSL